MNIVSSMSNKINRAIIIVFVVSYILCSPIEAYEMESPAHVTHQHITKQALDIWASIPFEIIENSLNNINSTELDGYYDVGDDTITGSAEEDIGPDSFGGLSYQFAKHFWEPDNPDSQGIGDDDYNDGFNLFGVIPLGSSYDLASTYWNFYVVPFYLQEDLEQSYYYIGRVAHLIEDASQPSHVHDDAHGGTWILGGSSYLEE